MLAIGFLGLAGAAEAAPVAPYPTVTTAPATTTPAVSPTTLNCNTESTAVGAATVPGCTNVHAADANQGPTTTPVVASATLARTGTDSGKIALLGLAALGAGGVCVTAARRRSTQS